MVTQVPEAAAEDSDLLLFVLAHPSLLWVGCVCVCVRVRLVSEI